MSRYRISAPIWAGLGLLVLAGCAAQPAGTASQAPVAALQPGMARVWVLRQPSSPGGNVAAADPMVYANGAPLAQSAQGTVYFHDFQPGTYRLTVPNRLSYDCPGTIFLDNNHPQRKKFGTGGWAGCYDALMIRAGGESPMLVMDRVRYAGMRTLISVMPWIRFE